MRILVFSDLHDEEGALERLKKHYDNGRFDLVLSCGDTTNQSVSFAGDVLSSFPGCLLVPGNNEPPPVMDFIRQKEKNYIHEKRVEIGGGLNVVGFGYSNITPFNTNNEYEESEIYERMSRLKIDHNTILLLHCPPYGYFDVVRGKNIGSTSIKQIIEEKQPLAALFGHAHQHKGSDSMGKTKIIKIPAAVNYEFCELEIRQAVTARFVKI